MSAESDERDRLMRTYPGVTARVLTDHPAGGAQVLEVVDKRLEDDPLVSTDQQTLRDSHQTAGSDTSMHWWRDTITLIDDDYT